MLPLSTSGVGTGSAPSLQLQTRKLDGQKSARKGDLDAAWQRMGMRQFKRTARQQAECVAVSFGDIHPLGAPLLDFADIRFTGLRYGSDRDGKTVTVAEAETATGRLDHDTLDALAEVAAHLPRV